MSVNKTIIALFFASLVLLTDYAQATTQHINPMTGSNVWIPNATTGATLEKRFSKTVNIQDDYGAVGDGTTDNCTTIQNAFNANPTATIIIPAGTFNSSCPILLTDTAGHNFQGAVIGVGNPTVAFTTTGNSTDADSAMQHGFQAYAKTNGTGGDTTGMQYTRFENIKVTGPLHGAGFYVANSIGVIFKNVESDSNRYGVATETNISDQFLGVHCSQFKNACIGWIYSGDTSRVWYGATPTSTYWNDSMTVIGGVANSDVVGGAACIIDMGSNAESTRNVSGFACIGTSGNGGIQYGYLGRAGNPTISDGTWFENIKYPVAFLTTNTAGGGSSTHIPGISGAEPNGFMTYGNFADGFSYTATITNIFTVNGVNDIDLSGVSGGPSTIGRNISLNTSGYHLISTQSGSTLIFDEGDTTINLTGSYKNLAYNQYFSFPNLYNAMAIGGSNAVTFSGNVMGNADISGVYLKIHNNYLSEYLTNNTAEVGINYTGYNGGITQFRNFQVYNGKSLSSFIIQGSNGFVGIGSTVPRASLDDSSQTDAILLPGGTTGQRPGSPANGMIRYNSSATPVLEGYVNSVWSTVPTLPIANAGLSNSSLTIAGHVVSLGGTQTLACSDLSNGATGCSTATGTSGATIPILNANNTQSGTMLFTGTIPSLANGNASIGASATAGGLFTGQGSTSDITIQNKSGASICAVATGTTTLNCTGLQISGTAVATTGVATLSSLTSIGTIGTGVWQGTVVGATYGGTGINNGSNTITLGGTLTTSGSFNTTLTVTATTNATLPPGTTTIAPKPTITIFASTGTFTPKATSTVFHVLLYGGGGGGGGGGAYTTGTQCSGGAGGGGGGHNEGWFSATDIGASKTVTIGTGGAGGAGGASQPNPGVIGTVGNNSSFGTLLYASGGGAGSGGTLAGSSGGGAGGNPSNAAGANGATGSGGSQFWSYGNAGSTGSFTGPPTNFNAGSGGAGTTLGSSGNQAGTGLGIAASGGSSGAGIATVPGSLGGGAGPFGADGVSGTAAGGTGGTGGAGGTGSSLTYAGGLGGGGGGNNTTATGGAGGGGGTYGGGGGGGGSGLTVGGLGGTGGNGGAIVEEW